MRLNSFRMKKGAEAIREDHFMGKTKRTITMGLREQRLLGKPN